MPLRTKAGKTPAPPGFETIEPTLEALDNELRDKVKESNQGKRNSESIWPVHQINWQRTRYVYDMYYTYKYISKDVYDYCIKNKFIDAALIAKWKKPGYERLCSTFVINPSNYKFGTTSICRVPVKDRNERQRNAQDATTGCLGCASGKDAGPRNIFGNKYGQNLAAIQIARERRLEALQLKQETEHERIQGSKRGREEWGRDESTAHDHEEEEEESNGGNSDTDDETDDEDDDDYGPMPKAGIWAGSKKLLAESEVIAEEDVNQDEEEQYEYANYQGDDDKVQSNKRLRP